MMVPFRARLARPADWPKPPRDATGKPAEPAPNHDGDTVQLEVDRYDDDSSLWGCRLLAVFTPEVEPLQPGGLECRTEMWRLLQEYDDGSRWPYWVDSVPNPRNPSKATKSFERYIGIVSNAARTRVLNHDIAAYAAAHGWVGGSGT